MVDKNKRDTMFSPRNRRLILMTKKRWTAFKEWSLIFRLKEENCWKKSSALSKARPEWSVFSNKIWLKRAKILTLSSLRS
jgi:hypothetical protein